MIQKVLDAMKALAESMPGISGLQVNLLPEKNGLRGAFYTINCDSETKVFELATHFGITVKQEHGVDSAWLAAYGLVTIYGPHRKTSIVEVSDAKVDAAVEQAHAVAKDVLS